MCLHGIPYMYVPLGIRYLHRGKTRHLPATVFSGSCSGKGLKGVGSGLGVVEDRTNDQQ